MLREGSRTERAWPHARPATPACLATFLRLEPHQHHSCVLPGYVLTHRPQRGPRSPRLPPPPLTGRPVPLPRDLSRAATRAPPAPRAPRSRPPNTTRAEKPAPACAAHPQKRQLTSMNGGNTSRNGGSASVNGSGGAGGTKGGRPALVGGQRGGEGGEQRLAARSRRRSQRGQRVQVRGRGWVGDGVGGVRGREGAEFVDEGKEEASCVVVVREHARATLLAAPHRGVSASQRSQQASHSKSARRAVRGRVGTKSNARAPTCAAREKFAHSKRKMLERSESVRVGRLSVTDQRHV